MPATLKDYQKYNPCRSPAWRDDRAFGLLEIWPRPGRPSRFLDDQYVHKYFNFLLKHQQAATEKARRALVAGHNPIGVAHHFRFNASLGEQALLEARILSRESDITISKRINLFPNAVAWYERLFFNVRDRLDAHDWVVKTIRDTAGRRRLGGDASLSERKSGQFYKFIGYFGGPIALDYAIGALSERHPQTIEEVDSWLNDEFHSCIRKLAVLVASEDATSDVLDLFRARMKLATVKTKGSDSAPSIQKNAECFLANLPLAIAPRGPEESKR